jgi:hypothetical protein
LRCVVLPQEATTYGLEGSERQAVLMNVVDAASDIHELYSKANMSMDSTPYSLIVTTHQWHTTMVWIILDTDHMFHQPV